MKTILITAYAVNPYKGSEEGTGWNLVCQAARYNRVIAVTRKNNKQDIEKYIESNPDPLFNRIQFLYFDLPAWTIFWKKGPLLSALYFYIWQFSCALWLKKQQLSFDISHSLNFHSNWTPSFLWMLGKPFVWGPVGNHPLIPRQYISGFYGIGDWTKDRLLWLMKWIFWNLDPFVAICRYKARYIFCVNSQSAQKLKLPEHKVIFMPAVASEKPLTRVQRNRNEFTVLSVGRFVPLKGFDLAIRAFACFYNSLPSAQRSQVHMKLIGKGPARRQLERLIEDEGMQDLISISEWMPRNEVINCFSNADVFLFPSHEGAGMVVAEALSYGMPVVCLDNFGPGEYIHPQSACKVAEGSYIKTVMNLSDKLSLLYSNDLKYQEESGLALERYEELFQWNQKGEVFRKVYNNIAHTPFSPVIINPVLKLTR